MPLTGLGTSNRPAIATRSKDTEVESMKYTGETRAMLKVKRHINKMSKETGIIDLIENKVKAEEIICSMKARRELSKRGYLSLRKHVKERIDSKLDAIPGKTACVAEATIR